MRFNSLFIKLKFCQIISRKIQKTFLSCQKCQRKVLTGFFEGDQHREGRHEEVQEEEGQREVGQHRVTISSAMKVCCNNWISIYFLHQSFCIFLHQKFYFFYTNFFRTDIFTFFTPKCLLFLHQFFTRKFCFFTPIFFHTNFAFFTPKILLFYTNFFYTKNFTFLH